MGMDWINLAQDGVQRLLKSGKKKNFGFYNRLFVS